MSTEDAMYEVANTINGSIDKGKKLIAIFLDLAKAFDTVSHQILINKLATYGIRGIPNQLFNNYLQDRDQCVKIGQIKSKFAKINCGIPQGTVLGPILFNIYINELLTLDTESKIVAYADDTVLLVEGDCWDNVMEKTVVEFSKIQQWLSENLLSINIEKTKFMYFNFYDRDAPNINTLQLHNYECLVNNKLNCTCISKLNSTKHIKYLGIIIDNNLKWSEHIEALNNKIRKLIWKFYHLRTVIPLKALKIMYHALAESILKYGILIWGGAYPSNLEQLKISQKFLIKTILQKNKRCSTDQIFAEFNVLNITLLYAGAVLVFSHKHKNILNSNIEHIYNTRNKVNLITDIPRYFHTTTQRFVAYYGPKLYNHLPLEFKRYNSISLFAKKITQYLRMHRPMFESLLM